MKAVIFAILTISTFLSIASASQNDGVQNKTKPQFVGIDSEFQTIVDEFKELSAEHDIVFTKAITIGFTKIRTSKATEKQGVRTIGVCYRNDNWREVDIDKKNWASSSYISRIALLFHELAHCYCNRNHDWAKDKAYPETEDRVGRLIERLKPLKEGGFYEMDACPLSLMYPVIPNEECLKTHGNEYLKEVFNRCDPY